jgi:hypothetical protein
VTAKQITIPEKENALKMHNDAASPNVRRAISRNLCVNSPNRVTQAGCATSKESATRIQRNRKTPRLIELLLGAQLMLAQLMQLRKIA